MKSELIEKGKRLKAIIERDRDKFGCVIQPALTEDSVYHLNLSDSNNVLATIDAADADKCWEVLKWELHNAGKTAAIGGYAEKRSAYRVNPELFGAEEEERCIHLGVDIWMWDGTPIHAPLDAKVHSFADNLGLGNYGPTIILEHELEGLSFFSLYGHLTRESLENLEIGQALKKGDEFGAIGSADVNGSWPPHLHYQFVADMMGSKGDFIGVASEAEADFYLSLCPEPVVL